MVYQYLARAAEYGLRNRTKKFNKKYPRIGKASSLAGKVFGLTRSVNIMKGLINVEKKKYDVELVSASVLNSGVITPLNNIIAGTAQNQREGVSILAKSIGGMYEVQEVATHETFYRFMIFYDLENQGSAPALSDILQSTSNPTSSPINTFNAARFWIVCDIVRRVDDYNPTINGKVWRKLNFHIKFKGPNAADYQKNSLFLLQVTDLGGAGQGPTTTIQLRLNYTDN